MTEPLSRILAEDYLGALEGIDMADLRARRAECQDVETGLSYLRRLVQGRLDVVGAELARRHEGASADDLEGLIARLPELLASSTRSPGTGRLPHGLGTGTVDATLERELDEIVTTRHLSDPSSLGDDDLDAVRSDLEAFEQKVSGLRRKMFDRIDAIESELTRRYRTGEATVDSLLS